MCGPSLLASLPGMAQSIPTRYPGKTAVLIGTGPSLTVKQINVARHAHDKGDVVVMGVNDSHRYCEFLDVLYVADRVWIDHHRSATRDIRPEKWTHHDPTMDGDYEDWNRITTNEGEGFSTDRTFLIRGGHSGYQLANLAYLMGCTTLILIGYDSHSGGEHHFGPHPIPAMQIKTNYARFTENWTAVAEQLPELGLNIVNATPGSAIYQFPRGDLGELLYGEAA